jgi:outer membrane receptor protein involved in Fe transport
LQANLAAIQQRLGLENLAFHTLADSASEKNAANLRNQADLLQGRRFGESARRSLLLQSLFNERPGNLPSALDIYGDGAGQTGATTPQHGAVSELNAQRASYNNYDELFGGRTLLEADAVSGSKNTNGEQIRLGVGSDTLGLGIAQRQFKTDGFAPFEYLDNRLWQAIVQWHPTQSTQAFVSYQTFNSRHGETSFPVQMSSVKNASMGNNSTIEDNSYVTRLGLRHSLTENSELRGLWSVQQTDQAKISTDFANPPTIWSVVSYSGISNAHSAELQYRRSGADYATQWGVQQTRGHLQEQDSTGFVYTDETQVGQQVYAAWQQALNPHWQMDTGLGLGKLERQDNIGVNSTSLARWLPRLGVVYTPDSGTHVRLAAWQGMGAFAVGDATLAPTSLAGVLLTRPGDDDNLVKVVSLGGDKQLSSAWLLAAQTQQRKTDKPVIFTAPQQDLLRQQVDESRLALHWQPQDKPWGVSLAYDDERIQNDSRNFTKDSVSEQHLRSQQLALHWFASAQCTVNLFWSHNQVAGTQHKLDYDLLWNSIETFPAYQDSFNQLDADLSWQFNKSGLLTAGVRNAADTRFQYTEISKLNPRFSNGRLVYARLKFVW